MFKDRGLAGFSTAFQMDDALKNNQLISSKYLFSLCRHK